MNNSFRSQVVHGITVAIEELITSLPQHKTLSEVDQFAAVFRTMKINLPEVTTQRLRDTLKNVGLTETLENGNQRYFAMSRANHRADELVVVDTGGAWAVINWTGDNSVFPAGFSYVDGHRLLETGNALGAFAAAIYK